MHFRLKFDSDSFLKICEFFQIGVRGSGIAFGDQGIFLSKALF